MKWIWKAIDFTDRQRAINIHLEYPALRVVDVCGFASKDDAYSIFNRDFIVQF